LSGLQRALRWRARHAAIIVLAAVLGLALVLPLPVLAQTCTADVQCQSGFSGRGECLGDTLVVRRSVCLGGACRSIEERRESCGGTSLRCAGGGVVERRSGRCDGLQGRCERRTDREICARSCTCVGNRLTVQTGECLAAIGCVRQSRICPGGCACAPVPECR
jgi:hypothetical protein